MQNPITKSLHFYVRIWSNQIVPKSINKKSKSSFLMLEGNLRVPSYGKQDKAVKHFKLCKLTAKMHHRKIQQNNLQKISTVGAHCPMSRFILDCDFMSVQ